MTASMLAERLHIPTPLLPSLALSALTGADVRLKMEALQPSGSFKLRGVGLACQHHARDLIALHRAKFP